ncbi:serine/threonine-protein kinase HAL4/sat4 [Lobulomyces angularis]|nr:serine/threonine-protein kinase HAL4/sat4 [Lobulomyces angularis]
MSNFPAEIYVQEYKEKKNKQVPSIVIEPLNEHRRQLNPPKKGIFDYSSDTDPELSSGSEDDDEYSHAAKKKRNHGFSEVSGLKNRSNSDSSLSSTSSSLIDGLALVRGRSASSNTSLESSKSFEDLRCKKIKSLGETPHAKINLFQGANQVYAVKEFKDLKQDKKKFLKNVAAEFTISSCFDNNIHIVKSFDLLKDKHDHLKQIMEFCAGGDLYHYIQDHSRMSVDVANCLLKQLVTAVSFLHEQGVAHRDLKPENLLFAKEDCRLLKIADFGSSEVFHPPFTSSHKASGLTGSGIYTAPEEFLGVEYDAPAVDIWAIGMIYYVMLKKGCPWKSIEDATFKHYLSNCNAYRGRDFEHFELFNRLENKDSRRLIYRMLDPNPVTRIKLNQLLEDEYFLSIKVCINEHTGETLDVPPHAHIS